jgi:sarcosine oxidase delta subunit
MTHSKEHRKLIFDYIKQHPTKTFEEISKTFSVCIGVISDICKENKFTKKRVIIQYFHTNPNRTTKEIGDKYGYTGKQIKDLLNKAGISIKKVREDYNNELIECNHCHTKRKRTEYYKTAKGVCKSCHKERSINNIKNNMERHKKYVNKWSNKNKEKLKEWHRNNGRKQINELTDQYMKNLLNQRFKYYGIDNSKITKDNTEDYSDIIHLNRKKVKLQRIVKKRIKEYA